MNGCPAHNCSKSNSNCTSGHLPDANASVLNVREKPSAASANRSLIFSQESAFVVLVMKSTQLRFGYPIPRLAQSIPSFHLFSLFVCTLTVVSFTVCRVSLLYRALELNRNGDADADGDGGDDPIPIAERESSATRILETAFQGPTELE